MSTWPHQDGIPKSLGSMTAIELRQARQFSRRHIHMYRLDKDSAKLREFLNQQKVHALDILIAIAEGKDDAARYE